ncbi:MAG: copper chaperone PCu(A)C [Acidimicrobiia bacterium]
MRNRLTIAAATAVALAACGGGDAAGIEIDGAWARTSPAMADAGAAYMQITASEADALVSASVDASVAGTVEIHEVVPADTAMTDDSMADDSMGDHSMDDDSMAEGMGAMMMREIEELTLPAGETVSLEPGGYHVMLLDLPGPLETGETFDLTLTFANAGEQVVSVEVREEAP